MTVRRNVLIFLSVLFGYVAALLICGFVAGYTGCYDCDSVASRVFLGGIWSILSVLSFGHIPGQPTFWPTALWVWILISGPLVFLFLRRPADAA